MDAISTSLAICTSPAMDATTVYPHRIMIGTKRAFTNNYAYEYSFNEQIEAFICETTTDTGLPGEVLLIASTEMGDGVWFVAAEGRRESGVFTARQAVFRTQENFWEAGQHFWQVNQNAGRSMLGRVPDPDWNTEWALTSETRHGTVTP